MNPTRLENRHGGGVPDLELQWPTGSAFVELKAPRSEPRTTLQTLQIRPHLFANSANFWEKAEAEGLTCAQLILEVPEHEFASYSNLAPYASKDQKAWHARRYANGGVSYFLQSTPGQGPKSLFSPYICPDDGALRLGLVCEHGSWSVVLCALRLSAEMHAAHALRLGS
jgi:hypothetical protein